MHFFRKLPFLLLVICATSFADDKGATSNKTDARLVFAVDFKSTVALDGDEQVITKTCTTHPGCILLEDYLDALIYIDEAIYARLMKHIATLPKDKAESFLAQHKILMQKIQEIISTKYFE